MTFDLPAVHVSAQEMMRIALRIGDEEGVANAHMRLAMYDVRCFHVASALEHLSYVRKFIESHWDGRGPCSVVLYCNMLLYLAYLYCELGRFDEGFAYFAQGEEQQRLRGSLHGRCNFLNSRAYLKVLAGRSEEARDDIRAALALLEQAPLMSRTVAHSAIGMAHRELGEIDEAIVNLERGVQTIRDTSPHDLFNLAGDLADLALTYLRAGEIERARATAAEYLAVMDGRTEGFAFPQRMLFIAAQVYREAGDSERAGELLQRADTELQRRLAEIPDDATRAIFLDAMVNREIVEARGGKAERTP
ncbi:MAG TPA: hypothetical protein VN224_13440 [Xanthomonadales bacterium]|nr:hypothetical protein [Xanthomonadales bacterium]